MQDPGHPICAALVKEFGVYPPGCFVTLASGETGVVVKRGADGDVADRRGTDQRATASRCPSRCGATR